MIPAKQLLGEIANSLRNVIAPAVNEPYPKAQAYMAAVILEFVSRQIEERTDIEQYKSSTIGALFRDLANLPDIARLADSRGGDELQLCNLIERLYQEREHLGEGAFNAANHLIRRALRQMLDQELKIAKTD
jgi:hypothetical protein